MFALKHKAGSSKIAQVEPIRGVQLSIPIELTQNGHRRRGLKPPYPWGMMAVAHVDSAPSDCGEPIADALNTLTLIRVPTTIPSRRGKIGMHRLQAIPSRCLEFISPSHVNLVPLRKGLNPQ